MTTDEKGAALMRAIADACVFYQLSQAEVVIYLIDIAGTTAALNDVNCERAAELFRYSFNSKAKAKTIKVDLSKENKS